MKETFNLGQETLYTIETPAGIIAFDINDHENIPRLKEMYSLFEKADKELRAQEVLIAKNTDNTKKDKFGLTERDKKELDNYDKYIKGCSNALDAFFGEGASDKIFYDDLLGRVVVTNARVDYLLTEVLPYHFEQAGLKAEEFMNERLKKRNRFVEKEKEVIDLDEEQS